jgi:serine/tyrosine/threonine adenylyltransferase
MNIHVPTALKLPAYRPALLADEGFSAKVQSGMLDSDPQLIHASPAAAKLIGIDKTAFADPTFADQFAEHFSGKRPQKHLTASVYSGHQFGTYVPQLGDGRALSYGVVDGPDGAIEVQLKGAGQTPYSRFADGRAVMRSSIREYLCSEAMAALGIPSTRALSVIGTGEDVARETMEPGAVVTRLAPCFVRFGHFEFFAHSGQPDKLRALAERVIVAHFPELKPDDFAGLFREVCERTARLMAKWQAVGFSHGVMNTDNMSILGLTIDYGPFGFMDGYQPMFICNHSDHAGRYAFARQPSIGLWNCQALAAAFAGLVDTEHLEAGLKAYEPAYHAEALNLMRAKIGMAQSQPEGDAFIPRLLKLMADTGADFTLTYRRLSNLDQDDAAFTASLFGARSDAFMTWHQDWRALQPDFAMMRST